MTVPFADSSAGTLRRLAAAFRSGQLGPPVSAFSIGKVTACAEATVRELVTLVGEGLAPTHLALLLDACADRVEAQANAVTADLVWTGPEGEGAHSRDTAVVVEELFARAERDVLVSTFVVQNAAAVFRPLAVRMDELPHLRARIFLHINRNWRDTVVDSELLREFAAEFSRDWPGRRRPDVFYDPRGLSADPAQRATWHAKCVVVDDDKAFITSANFTEWAHQRNAEAGVLLRSGRFAAQLRQQFDGLVQAKLVMRLPGV